MNWLIEKILAAMGWKKLLRMTWDAIHRNLEEKAASTDTTLDDDFLKILDEVINGLTA